MRTFPILGAFLLVSVAAAADQVSVLTWNIERAIGANSPNTSNQSYVAKVVNHLRPDVWTINELGGNAAGFSRTASRASLVDFVQSNLTIFGTNPVEGRDFHVYVGEQSDGFIANAIVSRYAFTQTNTYRDDLRGLVGATVALPEGNQLGVFTAHFKATTNPNQSTVDSERRQREAESARLNLEGYQQIFSDRPIVVTGDFNVSEDPGQNDNWANGDIGDTLPSGRTYAPVSTVKGAGLLDPVPVSRNGDKDTISSGSSNPRNRFDYNLYSDDGDIRYLGGTVFNTAAFPLGQLPSGFFFGDSGLASDHLPVLASYEVVPEPATLLALGTSLVALAARRRVRR